MQTIQIIAFITNLVSYTVMSFFACFAFFRLRRQERDLLDIKAAIGKLMAMTAAGHIRDSLNDLNVMRKDLRDLIDNERYEEAEKLKAFITERERNALRQIKHLREHFGDDVGIEIKDIRMD